MDRKDALQRLSVAVTTGHLPPDLGQWVYCELHRDRPAGERMRERNNHLRSAAGLLPPGSSRKHAEVIAAHIRRRCDDPYQFLEHGTFEWYVAAAVIADPKIPQSWRQVLRIL